jgi:hypothetical protein
MENRFEEVDHQFLDIKEYLAQNKNDIECIRISLETQRRDQNDRLESLLQYIIASDDKRNEDSRKRLEILEINMKELMTKLLGVKSDSMPISGPFHDDIPSFVDSVSVAESAIPVEEMLIEQPVRDLDLISELSEHILESNMKTQEVCDLKDNVQSLDLKNLESISSFITILKPQVEDVLLLEQNPQSPKVSVSNVDNVSLTRDIVKQTFEHYGKYHSHLNHKILFACDGTETIHKLHTETDLVKWARHNDIDIFPNKRIAHYISHYNIVHQILKLPMVHEVH